MSNYEQSSLDYYITKLTEILGPEIIKQISRDDNERIARLEKQAKEMYIVGKERSYAEGYSAGYYRALELVEWKIKNELKIDNK